MDDVNTAGRQQPGQLLGRFGVVKMCVSVWFLGSDLEMYLCVHLFILFVASFFEVLSDGLL